MNVLAVSKQQSAFGKSLHKHSSFGIKTVQSCRRLISSIGEVVFLNDSKHSVHPANLIDEKMFRRNLISIRILDGYWKCSSVFYLFGSISWSSNCQETEQMRTKSPIIWYCLLEGWLFFLSKMKRGKKKRTVYNHMEAMQFYSLHNCLLCLLNGRFSAENSDID